MLLAFSKQHLPEQTAKIEATHKQDYDKRNARFDERIEALKRLKRQRKRQLRRKSKNNRQKPQKKLKLTGRKQ